MVSRVDAQGVYKTFQRTLTYLRENILEPLSIIQSPKVYGWLQSDHFSLFHRIPEEFPLQYGHPLFSNIPRSGQNFVPHKSLSIDPSKYHQLIKENFFSENPFLHRNLCITANIWNSTKFYLLFNGIIHSGHPTMPAYLGLILKPLSDHDGSILSEFFSNQSISLVRHTLFFGRFVVKKIKST